MTGSWWQLQQTLLASVSSISTGVWPMCGRCLASEDVRSWQEKQPMDFESLWGASRPAWARGERRTRNTITTEKRRRTILNTVSSCIIPPYDFSKLEKIILILIIYHNVDNCCNTIHLSKEMSVPPRGFILIRCEFGWLAMLFASSRFVKKTCPWSRAGQTIFQ